EYLGCRGIIDVPETDSLVETGRHEMLAIGAEGNAGDEVAVAEVGLDGLTGAGVPEADGAVLAGGGESFAVAAEGEAPDAAGVSLAAGGQVAFGLPEIYSAVLPGGGGRVPGGSEGTGGVAGGVRRVNETQVLGRQFPALVRPAAVGGGEELPVGAEIDAGDVV